VSLASAGKIAGMQITRLPLSNAQRISVGFGSPTEIIRFFGRLERPFTHVKELEDDILKQPWHLLEAKVNALKLTNFSALKDRCCHGLRSCCPASRAARKSGLVSNHSNKKSPSLDK